MFIAYCLHFVVFTIQLFKYVSSNHCIHHLLPSDRKAKQNDKNQTILNQGSNWTGTHRNGVPVLFFKPERRSGPVHSFYSTLTVPIPYIGGFCA